VVVDDETGEVGVDDETGSEFIPYLDESLTGDDDDGETHKSEEDTPKPKKMKASIRQEIKGIHAKAAKEEVRFLTLEARHMVTINTDQKQGQASRAQATRRLCRTSDVC
jgi:hypothetical protein